MLQQQFFVALICCGLCPATSDGQIPRRLEDCLPIPSLAQEIRQRNEEAQPENQESGREASHIKVASVTFLGKPALPPKDLAQIAKSLTERSYGDGPTWMEEVSARVQDAWQQRGYFKANVENPRVHVLAGTPHGKRFAVSVSVDAGPLYRLNRIDFLHGTQFSDAEVRAFLPISDGDSFDTHAIQQGLENLRKAYGMTGFINFSSAPSWDIDEHRALITLILELSEGKPFRFGQIKVLGLDPLVAKRLLFESGLETGSIFNPSLVDRFFERNRHILPSDALPEEDTQRVIDEQSGTVDMTMDLRGCPLLH
jgi:outer membrane protein assembly factor BamA